MREHQYDLFRGKKERLLKRKEFKLINEEKEITSH